MSLGRWLRSKGRAAMDGLFCSSSPEVRRVGDEGSGWVIDTRRPRTVAYCAGVGQGISFELELAKSAAQPVLVFDPSPTGIATMAGCDRRGLEFLPIGLTAKSGVIEFSAPADPGEGSCSVPRPGAATMRFECQDLAQIMADHGHTAIDLLKLDIEGFEYAIVEQVLNDGIPVRQLCVEFHPWLKRGATWKTIARLYGAGYRIIHKHRGDFTFVLDEGRFQATARAWRSRAKRFVLIP